MWKKYLITIQIRQIFRQVDVLNRYAWRTLREKQLHPYQIQKLKALQSEDHLLRVQFCQWLLQEHAEILNFCSVVMGTDEVTFTHNSITKCCNTHIWVC